MWHPDTKGEREMQAIGHQVTTKQSTADGWDAPPGVAYRPWRFFGIVLAMTWIPGFTIAWLSTQPGTETAQLLLLIAGMLAPLIGAMVMISGRSGASLRKDYRARLDPRRIRRGDLAFILLVMPVAILLGTTISVVLGGSAEQFQLSDELAIMAGQSVVSLVFMFLAPTIEELGWRGYGVDALRSRFNVFQTCIVFTVFWGLWHLPLFFVQGYYNNQLWNDGLIYVVNWILQLLVASFLINWAYFRNRRSIIVGILLHISLVVFSEVFRTEESTKFLVTAVLLAIVGVIVWFDRGHFFGSPAQPVAAPMTPAQVAG